MSGELPMRGGAYGVLGGCRTFRYVVLLVCLFLQAEDGIRDLTVTGVQTCALPICRSLVGIGEAGYGPAAQALLAEFFQGQRRAFALGIYSVGMAFGGVIGIWLGGELAHAYGWRITFLAMGVPGFVLALLAAQLREPAQRPAGSLVSAVRRSVQRGVRRAAWYLTPLLGLALAGA